MAENVALLGLGTMGAGMAANLLKAGFSLTVYNRTAAKAQVNSSVLRLVSQTQRTAYCMAAGYSAHSQTAQRRMLAAGAGPEAAKQRRPIAAIGKTVSALKREFRVSRIHADVSV